MSAVRQTYSLDVPANLSPVDKDTDVLFQKIGDWAYKHPLYPLHNQVHDAMGGFPVLPQDAIVMEEIEEDIRNKKFLPTAHLYDKALERVRNLVTDDTVKNLLSDDLNLRAWMRSKQFEEVYE